MIKNCQFCNKVFEKPANCSKKSWILRKYCSYICDYNDGYIAKNCEKCNAIFTCIKGHTKRRFCSHKCGNSMKNYVSDRSKLLKYVRHAGSTYRNWSDLVKKRDGQKCIINNFSCNGRIVSHHILNWVDFPELRYDINNGITLCHAHHPRKRDEEAKLSPYFQELIIKTN